MTKADLIEEVSRVVEMTRKESEVIVEAIFEASYVRCATPTKLKSADSGVFVRGNGRRVSEEIQRPARGWKCLRRRFRISSQARNADVVNNSEGGGEAAAAVTPETTPGA